MASTLIIYFVTLGDYVGPKLGAVRQTYAFLLFFILCYDQQMHNYLTNYHTPYTFRHNRVTLRELVINMLPNNTSI
jgi:hypothetical protein